jgi:thiamine-phosphate pyrophosphorylase
MAMAKGSRIDFSLYLITDRKILPPGRSIIETVRAALEGGVRAIQLREKDLSAREFYSLALELRCLTRRNNAMLLINDRIDITMAVEADGVHLGRQSLPTEAARRILGPDKLIGVSTHHVREVLAAQKEGADFVTFGPVYHTPSKAPYGPPVGIGKLREACSSANIPVFALGGVKKNRLTEIEATGAAGAALISAILADPSPTAATRIFVDFLEKPTKQKFPPL